MLDLNEIATFVEANEGYRQFPYKCSKDKLTIGIGRNIQEVGITRKEALFLLKNDLLECLADLGRIFVDQEISHNRMKALVDMRFCLGPVKFRGFKKMITAIKSEDWQAAAREAEDSLWFKEVKSRGPKVIKLLLG